MNISARQKGGIIILDLSGTIDANAANLIEAVGMCVRQHKLDILCNFEQVDKIDYMGISVIVIAYKEAVNHKGRMKLVNVPVHLRGIFNVTGLEGVFEFYVNEEQALGSFKEDRVIEEIKRRQLRRRFKRLPIDVKVEFKSKFTSKPKQHLQSGEILDLSADGAYIYGKNDDYHLGEILHLKMVLMPQPGEVKLDARVVWFSDKDIQPHCHPGMGVEFYNISSGLQSSILEFIERNLPLTPQQE